MKLTSLIVGSAIGLTPGTPASASLKVSENQRFLTDADGRPFFWLSDTAWELFHRLNREEAERYLEDRRQKGFTVIQAVALAEMDGLRTPNFYGHRPLIDEDPERPDVKEGPENDYWDHVDYIVDLANAKGLRIAFLPTWGDKWHGDNPVFSSPEKASAYGEWLGRRYRDRQLVWVLGGDRTVENDFHRAIIRAMAEGLRRGDEGAHLITFHPRGGQGSAQFFHDEPWLDFNMRQNGHVVEFAAYSKTREDYNRQPVKPVLDGEPAYEGHPIAFQADKLGHTLAADVRRPLYWNLFTGAFGHTYGHHSIWQMASERYDAVNRPLKPWFEALDDPGAAQMQHGRALLESRPFLTRIPDDSILVPDKITSYIPGTGERRFVATRDEAGTYAMVYFPVSFPATVRMEAIRRGPVKAWWFDPRTGGAELIGEFPNTEPRTFTPPTPGELTDWVLVLDEAAQNYGAPGKPPAPQ